MQLIRDNPGRQILQSSVVTIGNFDGLHIGHQALIERCKGLAGAEKPVAVVSFEPLPQAWFSPESAAARLTSVRQKIELLEGAGVELVWLMRFNRQLANMSADDFVRSVLVDTLRASEVVVGGDFHYGKGRQGNIETLAAAGQRYGFKLNTVATVELADKRASSTRVRADLADGDFEHARDLLGRPYRMQGRVIRGKQLGRELGYPTANMRLATAPSPIHGIFAVRARFDECGEGKTRWYDGVANLGTRPAVGGEGFLVEVHLFDFDADLYGRRMQVEYLKKLRDEVHFADIDDLVQQMREDERLARIALSQIPETSN